MAAPLQSRTIGQGIEEIEESNLSFLQDSSRSLMTIDNGRKSLYFVILCFRISFYFVEFHCNFISFHFFCKSLQTMYDFMQALGKIQLPTHLRV